VTHEDGLVGFTETSVTNCQCALRNVPEDRRSYADCSLTDENIGEKFVGIDKKGKELFIFYFNFSTS
jgi:hypothetical protein